MDDKKGEFIYGKKFFWTILFEIFLFMIPYDDLYTVHPKTHLQVIDGK